MDNLRGAALMTFAMLGFAIEDMCIKLMSGVLPTWQIILVLGVGGTLAFAGLVLRQNRSLLSRDVLLWTVQLRNICEVLGAMTFVTALAVVPISTASAILQAAPLIVTSGAALFLGETIGWRRWSAVVLGFIGVLLIVRPGTDSFEAASLFAVAGVFCLATRDLATRLVPKRVSSLQLSFWAFAMLIPTAGLLAIITGDPYVAPSLNLWLLLLACIGLGVIAYYAVVAAMRVGDVGFVTPFRYSRMLFALVVGALVFSETPDAAMLLGAALIVGSGLFTFWRDVQVKVGQRST